MQFDLNTIGIYIRNWSRLMYDVAVDTWQLGSDAIPTGIKTGVSQSSLK
jgi:hypothetical protein